MGLIGSNSVMANFSPSSKKKLKKWRGGERCELIISVPQVVIMMMELEESFSNFRSSTIVINDDQNRFELAQCAIEALVTGNDRPISYRK